MIIFTVGSNIKTNSDKVIFATKNKEIINYLSKTEQFLKNSIKKQSAKDKIKAYNLGGYTLYASVIPPKMTRLEWNALGAETYKILQKNRDVKILLDGAKKENIFDFSFGLEMASYRFDKYFTKKPASFYPTLEKITYVSSGLTNFEEYKNYASLNNAIRYARDLCNEPANNLSPEIYSEDIKRLEYLGLEVNILDEEKMRENNFGLALAVGQGSVNRPKIAIIKWNGNKENNEYELGLVGKGVTFDSGGLSLKPNSGMLDMKQDMTGSSVVVATMKSIALQKIEKNIVAVVGLVENMPSGTAYRPGDVLTSMSGQTVEIHNTDAEGRLVLADCLTYIQKTFNPKYVIDIATLTGAISSALGNVYAGIFSNNLKFANTLIKNGETVGERLWLMPLGKEFDKMMDSNIADMKNSGGRLGGSSTAACFLQRYIEKNTNWAHLDIAGVDGSDGTNPLYPKGASGFGVRLLNNFIINL